MSESSRSEMPPKHLFSVFDVSRQVFYRSPLSLGIVNLKPLIPGHVLVLPKRVVPRLSDLNSSEISDLFSSVQRIGTVLEKAYSSQALTVSIQDGEAAGQSVPHLHVHLIPRKATDFGGNNDEIYPAIEANEVSLGALHRSQAPDRAATPIGKSWDLPKDEDRRPRTIDEMAKEAEWLAAMFPIENRP